MTRGAKSHLLDAVRDSAGQPPAAGRPSTAALRGVMPAAAEPARERAELSFPVLKLTTWEESALLGPGWDELLAESSSPTSFLTREWLVSWWKVFGGSRELLLLACVAADGRLLGVAPLYRERRRLVPGFSLRVLRLVGDGSGDSDNLDWIIRRGQEPVVVKAFLDWLARHRSEWDLLDLNTVPAESAVARALTGEFRARQWSLCREERPHLVLPLPEDWDTYLGSLSRNMRAGVVFKQRRLEKNHRLQLRRCERESDLPRFLETLFQLHTRRWKLRGEPGTFHPARRQFYEEMTRPFLARGWLDFWLLDLDGQAVATQLGFHYGDTYCFLQSGFDPAYAAMSVGVVLTSLILRDLIRRGIRAYDFLAGEELHKQRWGAERRGYAYLSCARPWSRGAFCLAVARRVEAGKAWLRARLSPTARQRISRACQRLRFLRAPVEGAAAPAGEHSAVWLSGTPVK